MRVKLNGQSTPRELTDAIRSLKGDYEITFEKVTGKRTPPQNNSLHLWCKKQAEEFMEKRVDMREFFKDEFFLEWTLYSVKDGIWKKMQKALFRTDSTTELTKNEQIDIIHRNIARVITEKYKGEVLTIPFPNESYHQDELFKQFKNKTNENKKSESL